MNTLIAEKKTKKQLLEELANLRQRMTRLEHDFNLMLHNIPAIVFKGFADWTVDFLDNKIEMMTGYPKIAFDSRQIKWSDIMLAEDLGQAKAIFIQALKSDNKTYVREYRIKNKEGNPVWIQERSCIICRPDGAIDYISGFFFDITERVKIEENAHKRCEYLESLVLKLRTELLSKAQ